MSLEFWLYLIPLLSALGFSAGLRADELVEIHFDEAEVAPTGDEESFLSVEKIFKNPVLASGLVSGTEVINRSLDSLMEALFYSLLDRELVYDVTDNAQFVVNFSRTLHTTSEGSYVVVDRFGLGPSFSRVLSTLQGAPITLGSEGRVNILNIYPRSDGMRLADDEDLPAWRMLLNNWFGILPLLTNALPPSFNPNEMYDPLSEIETAFLFPFEPGKVPTMPVGSIRSYAIAGGLHLPFDLSKMRSEEVRERLLGVSNATLGLPLSIFKTGEHRINVLRKTATVAWVGLSEDSKVGSSISIVAGKSYRVLAKLVSYWKGLPAVFLPIDVTGSLADNIRFDQLYSFDLSNPVARAAYFEAVKGDFTEAWNCHVKAHEQHIPTGVEFHFKRDVDSTEAETTNNRSLFVHRATRHQMRTKSEIETTDQLGKFYTLEAKSQINDEEWDVLVGAESINFESRAELKVIRVKTVDRNGKESHKFDFGQNMTPISVTMSVNLTDRFVDAEEYRNDIEFMRYFTKISMPEIPVIPLRDAEKEAAASRALRFANPMKDAANIHVTPTHLGEMTINAAVYFDTKNLDRILESSESEKWRQFALAFGLPEYAWEDYGNRLSSTIQSLKILGSYAAYPLRLINVRIAAADALREATTRIRALNEVAAAVTPEEKLDAFGTLFDCDYPAQLVRALLGLSQEEDIPRSISFSTKPKGKGSPEAKRPFEGLNRKIFRSESQAPAPERYRITRDKLQAFNATELREERNKPLVTKIQVRSVPLAIEMMYPNDTRADDRHILVKVRLKNVAGIIRAYVRLEQGGRMNVGRFVLAEKILTLPLTPVDGEGVHEESEVQFFLTGPKSELNSFLFQQAIELGGQFDLSLAISDPLQIWSQERKVQFRFENGLLLPP